MIVIIRRKIKITRKYSYLTQTEKQINKLIKI